MVAIGIVKSYDEIRDDSMESARLSGLVAKTLEEAAKNHVLISTEHDALSAAARRYRKAERANLEYAGCMEIAMLCIEAGFPPELSSPYEIGKAHQRWRDASARAT